MEGKSKEENNSDSHRETAVLHGKRLNFSKPGGLKGLLQGKARGVTKVRAIELSLEVIPKYCLAGSTGWMSLTSAKPKLNSSSPLPFWRSIAVAFFFVLGGVDTTFLFG